MASKQQQAFTQSLLERAHSPDTANRIFSDSIQHRPLRLRATSPPPTNARANRRAARELAKKRRKIKPAPLSSRQRRTLGLYDVPANRPSDAVESEPKGGDEGTAVADEGTKAPPKRNYEIFKSLHKLWLGYIHEVLGNEIYDGGAGAAAKLSAAEFHGAELEVVRSGCVSRVGVKGIVVKDTKFVFEIVTKDDKVKVIPKEKTVFRIRIPAPMDAANNEEKTSSKQVEGEQIKTTPVGQTNEFVFELHGDQFRLRSADRANRKFKQHFLKNI